MAGPGAHPIHIHPARPLYRFAATGLGASMWFFLMYRAKQDGNFDSWTLHRTIPNLTRRTCIIGLEASLGPLNEEDIQWRDWAAYDSWARTDGHVASVDGVQIIHVKWKTQTNPKSTRDLQLM
ncbi:hypothetical protein VE03_03196 [Pseudogymnoascus sp. 23342-1-I1]|nr:hypothetical protein VE03_03196 [Pseudogymnoascus sp. 23342-1-I1]